MIVRIARIIVSQGSAEGNCAANDVGGAGKGIDEAIATCHRVRVPGPGWKQAFSSRCKLY